MTTTTSSPARPTSAAMFGGIAPISAMEPVPLPARTRWVMPPAVPYDGKNKVTQSVDAIGNVTVNTYSTDGKEDLLTTGITGTGTAPFHATSSVSGYSYGLPATFTDPLNFASSVGYDGYGKRQQRHRCQRPTRQRRCPMSWAGKCPARMPTATRRPIPTTTGGASQR